MLAAWETIIQTADPWLDTFTLENLQENVIRKGKPISYKYGNFLQRVIYHYWYHLRENMAIRQQLGHECLPVFVGNIDSRAPLSTGTATGVNSRFRAYCLYLIIPKWA